MPTFCAFPLTTLAHFLDVVFFFNMIWPFLWHINVFNVRQELVGQKRHNDSHKDRQQCAKQQVDHPFTLRVKKPLSRDKNSALQYVQYGRRLYRLYVSRLRCSSDLPNDCRKSSNIGIIPVILYQNLISLFFHQNLFFVLILFLL